MRYSALPGHTTELAQALNEELSQTWAKLRGIEIVSFGVSSVKASEEDEAMIKELQRNAAFRNPNMAAAQLVGAQAQAMQDAAKNQGGAMMGFMGMNAAQGAGGVSAQSLFAMGERQRRTPAAGSATPGSALRPREHRRFCMECGEKKPEPIGAGVRVARSTGNLPRVRAKKRRREGLPRDKCGWEP